MYLTLEDLVPNALIELVENDVNRSVSYPTILKYGDVVVKELEKIEEINAETVKQAFKNVSSTTGVKGKNLFMPIRLKLTGVSHGIELVNIIKILGKEEVIRRLSN